MWPTYTFRYTDEVGAITVVYDHEEALDIMTICQLNRINYTLTVEHKEAKAEAVFNS